MSLARGKFGIEYNPRQAEREPSGLGWVIALAALAAFVALAWTLVRRIRAGSEEAALVAAVEGPAAPAQTSQPSQPSQPPQPPLPSTDSTFQAFQPLNAELARRPPKVRNLLMRLEEAEKRRDVEMAVTTIETIRALPGSPAADIDDSLARRLGALNVQRLFDLRSAQWVKTETVGRGDSATRIAAENGSTFGSLARLNGGRDKVEKIVIGQKLHVMNHPRFNLVLHRRTKTADLSLNGKFFKRYDVIAPVRAAEGNYETSANLRSFWFDKGISLKPADRAELETLLPPKTPVLISEL